MNRMTDSVYQQAPPAVVTVGIFWFIGHDSCCGEVLGVQQQLKPGERALSSMLDSDYEHWQIWEQQPHQAQLPLRLLAQEYFVFPRGRLLFDLKHNRHRIFCDAVLLTPAHKSRIKRFFRLSEQPVTWRADPHYTTEQQQLDTLWTELERF